MQSERLIVSMRKIYPTGTKLELVNMEDDVNPVPSGTIGEVLFVDDIGQIHVDWENGSSLAVIPNVDKFKKI